MFSQVDYSVFIPLEELELHLHSDFLGKLKKLLHVDSLSRVHVSSNSIGTDIVLFSIGENKDGERSKEK